MWRNGREQSINKSQDALSYIAPSQNNGLFTSNSELIQYAKEKADREIKHKNTEERDK